MMKTNTINWFFHKGTRQGVFWAALIYLTSSINDVLMRLLGERLHFVEIIFFRFLFSVIIVLIPMLLSKNNLFKSNIHAVHISRSFLGAIALGLCCYSVIIMPLAENTIILFSESLFLLLLSLLFLKEKPTQRSIIATIIGFLGLLIMFKPKTSNINLFAFIPTIAALLFAIMDIMIKKMVDIHENNITMLFYFGLYTAMITGIFVPLVWKIPTLKELSIMLLLGIGANLIQLFLFLAYRATNVANIASVKYIELLFSILFGYLCFNQIPTISDINGAVFIIVGTFMLLRSDQNKF